MISTNNYKFLQIKVIEREYGWIKKNFSVKDGYNKRLDELHAAILNIKLFYLEKFNNKRT